VELQRALTEALEQQTATAEILKVISRSAFDLQPVLETLLENASRLCAAEWGVIFRPDSEGYRMAAVYGAPPEFKEFLTRTPIPPGRGSGVGRAALERRPVQVVDVSADPEYRVTEFQRIGGFRTVLAVPMLREATLLGVFGLHRDQVRPFTEKQIQVVSTFADQAAIAIENVRLFAELQEKNLALTHAHAQVTEALEQQTATGQILGVIAASPTDVQPVFDTIARSTARLCEASNVMVFRVDGDILRLGAHHGSLPAGDVRLHRDTVSGRAVLDRQVIHLADAQAEVHEFPEGSALARGRGIRTSLSVPLVREGIAIGNIQAQRNEVRPFSDQQISLLKTFADQAVIAIENVRLFTELQEKNRALTEAHVRVTEALDQQTATSGILGVISSSPTDAQPVFDAIVRSASRLCGGEWAIVTRYDGKFLHLAAQDNPRPGSADAASSLFPHVPHPARSITARALVDSAVVHVSDVETEDLEPSTRELYRRIRLRAIIAVPMIHEGRPIGVLSVSRETPGPFSDRQTDLLRTFADQAVIAIENVRLFKELQEKNQALTQAHAQVTESLEQQTATAEILGVISSSPTDVQPVFDTIVASAVHLLGGYGAGLTRLAGDQIELVALTSIDATRDAAQRASFPRSIHSEDPNAQVIRDRVPLVIADAHTDSRLSAAARTACRVRGFQSVVLVPLLRHDEAIGTIGVTRRESGGFSDDEIALLQTFADQAVIAIENVRLFTELQTSNRELTTALDTQTATSDILRVISRSQTDVQPVFDTIVASASRLLRARSAVVTRLDGDAIDLVALTHSSSTGGAALREFFPQSLQASDGSHAQALRALAPLNVADAETEPRLSERCARTPVCVGTEARSSCRCSVRAKGLVRFQSPAPIPAVSPTTRLPSSRRSPIRR